MKFKILCFLFLIKINISHSQIKYDYQWTLGYDATSMLGDNATLFDFNEDTLVVTAIDRELEFQSTNSSICNKEGELLFYTNGCEVRDSADNLIQGTDNMSPGFIDDGYCNFASPAPQSAITIPHPSLDNSYYLFFYEYILLTDPLNVVSNKLSYFLIQDTDSGIILSEKGAILNDTLIGYIQTVKHANGRDWWIINHEFGNNCFQNVLVSNTGFDILEKQCLGSSLDTIIVGGQAVFSPDGSKYIFVNSQSGIHLYDFDRCTGVFSNPNVLNSLTNDGFVGVAVSPSSQYMYINYNTTLYQYDLWTEDVEASKIFIDESDGMPFPYYGLFYLMQLAPDSKIYMAGTGGHKHYHVIHQPDEMGLACNFEQHGIPLPSFNVYSIPNFPHYRLGAIEGSPCDTLTTFVKEIEQKELKVKVFPNPSQGNITIAFPEVKEKGWIKIINVVGEVVYQTTIFTHSNSHSVELSTIKGFYFIQIDIDGHSYVDKLVIE